MPLLTNLFSSLTMSKPNQNPNLSKDHGTSNPQNANNKGLSFFAFLFSISFYISIFFFFNLSPSSLLHSTKFWFAISNNLILIIAADYGSFSSSPRNNLDLYDQYMAKTRTASPKKPVLDRSFQENFEDKKVISFSQETKNPSLEIVVRYDPIDSIESFHDAREIFEVPRKGKSRTFRRRSSGKARGTPENESRMVLRRSESERRERVSLDHRQEEEEEENEFSRMSNEELNKRVEEFIQRFNRQMRLQRLEAANF